MGRFAEWTFEGSFETGIARCRRVGADGDHDRYLVAYMTVYEKVGICQIEWYRGSKRSSQIQETVFETFFVTWEIPLESPYITKVLTSRMHAVAEEKYLIILFRRKKL